MRGGFVLRIVWEAQVLGRFRTFPKVEFFCGVDEII